MALSFNANLHQPSLSCGSNHYAGLKLQSQVPFASCRPNLTAELFKRVHKSLHVSRMAMPLSRIALQAPAGAARGQADDILNEADELLRIRDYLYKELAKNTGQPVEKIYKDLSRMKRFNAEEALEYGLIDRIVRPPKISADAPPKDTGIGLG